MCMDDQIGNEYPDFRLWLTSKPDKNFPVSILQRSVKLTKEPPGGIRANMKSSLTNDITTEPGFFDGIEEGPAAWAWKKLLFSLCLFHASVQERRSFGSMGWNILYEYSESDLKISLRQLRKAFEPWESAALALEIVDAPPNDEKTDETAVNEGTPSVRDPDVDRQTQLDVCTRLPLRHSVIQLVHAIMVVVSPTLLIALCYILF